MGWLPSYSTWAILLGMPTLVFTIGSLLMLPLPKLVIFAFLNVLAALWTRTLYRRLVRDTALPQPWHALAIVAVALFGISSCLGPTVSRFLSGRDGSWLGTVMLVCCASNAFLVPLTVILDIIFWIRQPRQPAAHADAKQRHGSTLRNAQVARKKAAALLALTLLLVSLALIQGAQEPTIVHVDVYLKGLPPSADGFVLVQVSDLHVGAVIGHRFLARVVERINTLGAGVVTINGDLVDCQMADCAEALEPLANLRAPTFFVTGNHEYMTGNVPALKAHLKHLQVRPLSNEHVTIPSPDGDPAFVLAGVEDWIASDFGDATIRPNIAAALAGRPAELPVVLLAHQPRHIHNANKHAIDLVLSGHTHSGQIFPLHALAWLGNPYFAGLYQHSDTTAIYVGSGTAFWGPPMRLLAPAEITIVHLHPQRTQEL